MDISVIVPLYNEEDSLPKLYEWVDKVMTDNKFSYEIIFICVKGAFLGYPGRNIFKSLYISVNRLAFSVTKTGILPF